MSERATVTETIPDGDKLDKFKADIAKDADVVDEQRRQANEDMRFVNVTGGMWEDFLPNTFDDDRVKLEFDVVSNFLQRFLGEADANNVGVEFKPDDSATSDDDAELLNGIYRADFRNFSGEIATNQAEEEQATCGYGALKLSTVFEDGNNPENDNMRIEFRPIANAYNSVFWAQSAQLIDKQDAPHCTVLKAFTKDSFKAAYPDKSAVSAYTPENQSSNNNTKIPELIYIATRYEVVRKKESVFVYNNLKTSEVEVYNKEDHALVEDELRASDIHKKVRERKIIRQTVEKTVFSGEELLEPTRRIVGKFIPIIPFYGYRQYVDGVEWYRGLVRKLKDAARLFNMQVSQLAENAASGGQDVPIFDPEQMENPKIADLWADKNNQPYLLAAALRDNEGNIVAPGPIGYSKAGQLDGSITALMGIVPNFIQDVTGGAPQDTLDPNASGKAIQAMLKRENMATRTITKNKGVAYVRMGEVYQAMAAEVYTTQRIIGTIGKDGEETNTQLFKTIMDEETGQLIEANTLKGKKFRAYSDVGPQYETMREQTVEDLKGMLDAMKDIPGGEQYVPAILAVLLENVTGVGLDPIKELNRRIMLQQGLVKPDGEEEEAIVAEAQQPKEDPNAKFLESAAAKEEAEARNLDAKSLDNVASANKKEAETVEIFADMKDKDTQTNLDIQKQFDAQQSEVLKTIQSFPVN